MLRYYTVQREKSQGSKYNQVVAWPNIPEGQKRLRVSASTAYQAIIGCTI
jgi:hypothetical protein